MSDSTQRLLQKIAELEGDLRAKDAELAKMRLRLDATNVKLEAVIESVSHELKAVSKIQKLLSPVEIPHIQGLEFSTKFIPGDKSGGDYFDIFEHEDRLRFGVVLSSCSGYGVSALFLSILMKISSRMEARQGLAPHDMIKAILTEMAPEMKPADRASLFYGVVDRRSFEMTYCLMGDVLGIVQVSGQDALQKVASQGPALSKDFKGKLQSGTVLLNPRDRVVLVTEGVFLDSRSGGASWGESGVIEAVRAAPRQGVHELRNEILYRCEAFSGKTEPDRDRTVLAFEVKDKVIKLARN